MRHSWLLDCLTKAGLRDVTEDMLDHPRLQVSGVLGDIALSWIATQASDLVLSNVFALAHLRGNRPPTEAEVDQWIEAARRVGRSYSDAFSVYHADGWRALWRGQSVALVGVDAELADTFFKGDDTAGAALWDRLEEFGSGN